MLNSVGYTQYIVWLLFLWQSRKYSLRSNAIKMSSDARKTSKASKTSKTCIGDSKKLNFLTDIRNPLLVDNFEQRGWAAVPKWDLFWTNTLTLKISPSYRRIGTYRLRTNQKVNHFPNSEELCRKDLLAKNLQRYIHNANARQHAAILNIELINFLPATYHLPNEYKFFEIDYHQHPNSIWIMKPFDRCQGNGIFLIDKLAAVTQRMAENKANKKDQYLISRYIDNPLLICGKKFDIRLYVLVTAFRPLKAYLYNDGFCRLCCERYTNQRDHLDNKFVHLTNIGVQKKCSKFNAAHGGKWSLASFRLYLTGTRGEAAAQKMFARISAIIKHSLKAVQPVIHSSKHFFECYGYDILIDDTLKPWLLEVNSKPSLNATTDSDRILKKKLIESILNIVVDKQRGEDNNFKVLFCEKKDPPIVKCSEPKQPLNKIRKEKLTKH